VDEQSFKQRMVGAIVLVALAVIFIPMLLSGHRDKAFLDAEDAVPPKPAILKELTVMDLKAPIAPPVEREVVRTPVDKKTPIDKPARGAPAPGVKPKIAKSTPAPSANGAQPHTTPTPRHEMKPIKPKALAWAVQLGSFSKRGNAMRLRDKVRGKGYAAFVEKIASDGKVSYRVRVGPEVKRGEAAQKQKAILKNLNIKGLVVRHP